MAVVPVNARHVRSAPGRKSDVADCEWLRYLHTVGLLRGSFRPADEVCAVRSVLDRHGIDSTPADVIKVRGESMEPTLPDGCSILMDRRRQAPRSGRIYVVRADEGIVVKRARRDRGRWILSSDHPDWPPRPGPRTPT